jgi:Flp pilus assembly pilin Flp
MGERGVTAVSYALMVAIAVLLLSAALIYLQGGIRSALRGGGTCVDQPSGAGCLPSPGGGGPGPPGPPGGSTTTSTPTSSSTSTSTTVP